MKALITLVALTTVLMVAQAQDDSEDGQTSDTNIEDSEPTHEYGDVFHFDAIPLGATNRNTQFHWQEGWYTTRVSPEGQLQLEIS